jgi:hypothetical protein
MVLHHRVVATFSSITSWPVMASQGERMHEISLHGNVVTLNLRRTKLRLLAGVKKRRRTDEADE